MVMVNLISLKLYVSPYLVKGFHPDIILIILPQLYVIKNQQVLWHLHELHLV